MRALPAFRWLLALSLALGVIWHPVLTALGEMHAAAHTWSGAPVVLLTLFVLPVLYRWLHRERDRPVIPAAAIT